MANSPAQSGLPPAPGPDPKRAAAVRALLDRYWRRNVTIMLVLLAIWGLTSLGLSIVWAEQLNQFHLGGFPLGFWFAQQGSIVVFVLLILTYSLLLNRLDRQHHEQLQALGPAGPQAGAPEAQS